MLKKALIAAALVVGVSGTAFAGNWMYFDEVVHGDTGEKGKVYVKDISRSGNYASAKVAIMLPYSPSLYATATFYCGQPRIYTVCDINGADCAQGVLQAGTSMRSVYDFLCN